MKTTVSLPVKKPNLAYSQYDVQPGRLYKTGNGSIVFMPQRGVGVPTGYYVTLVHGKNPAMNMAIRCMSNSAFPWTLVDSGATVTLAQE
ncbi:hypothetical protein UFOVP823_49 [uncultured Caudovirales phage]|uniref:Uncharacterized protein n=1 Tax=uncultured Caudovirales phage TaxID=2100421 RepID=A0A6J5P0X1_9CAUD|nr:hypothetical protein UFOVP823_49 [uncultured Caudovirales phage]